MRKEVFLSFLLLFVISSFIYIQLVRKPEITKESVTNQSVIKEKNNQAVKRGISWEEISKHNKPNDCWIVIEEKVYNITDYVNNHPGGKVIIDYCGKEATEAFNNKGSRKQPHSNEAQKIRDQYYIGNLSN